MWSCAKFDVLDNRNLSKYDFDMTSVEEFTSAQIKDK